jgi:cytochrome c oxidase subunit 2
VYPNLTTVKADPEYLRRWLANPSALKPNTEMPNLGLSETEIDALVAFLTEGN